MTRRHIPATLLLSVFLILAGTTGVLAKEDAIVTLDAALPTDPEPGTDITVGWTVESLGEDGSRTPFNAELMFVRLIPAAGDPVDAIGRQGPAGHYVATVTVPSGGIADVAFGLRGESCSGGTCQDSDILFTVDDSPTAATEPGAPVYNPVVDSAVVPTGAAGPVSADSSLPPLGVIGLVLAAVAILGALSLRGRSRTLTAGSNRS